MGGIGPIAWTALDRYAERYSLDDEAYERFVMFIRSLDGVYVAEANKKPAAEPPKTRKAR